MKQSINILKKGGVGILPTDTIYGLVGSALNKETVERIYKLRKRSPQKPMIILISSLNDLELFNTHINQKTKSYLKKLWPNSLSIIFECYDQKFEYLHRGTNSLAFRFPNDENLLEILKQTGPLVAPSANFEGEPPAENIEQAKIYFGESVDFYFEQSEKELTHEDQGTLKSQPSTLIEIKNDKINILRQGAYKLPNE